MDQETARRMFEEGGTLVLLGMPYGTEFGIDMNSWNIAEKFKGVKMIPPGLHFIYYSAVNREGDTAPRTGFFHFFKQREVLVRHYDPATEDLKAEETDEEEVARIRSNLRDLDRHLGAYPIESWKKWVSLSQHVSAAELGRMEPLSGKICSVPELIRISNPAEAGDAATSSSTSGKSPAGVFSNHSYLKDPDKGTHNPGEDNKIEQITEYSDSADDDGQATKKMAPVLPDMVQRPGTEMRFSKFPEKPYREGATPAEITRYSLDSSYSIGQLVKDIEQPECLLSELQLAFVCFLVGQVWEGWEHWRKLVMSLCSAEEFIQQNPALYEKFLSALHFQIHEVPEDLFVDIVESNNFLASALTSLFANISDNTESLPASLVTKARKFKTHITNKFKWNLTLEDDGEDAPVIVEL
ncbi:protein AAR2 homolog [Penaeus japonicus]|uniref:protein AAR2 homolog n=1 Tax=Penaeus japonicus TaxID=27405 RepID=UPI001C7134D3|nr:protein AAR2 homolog [Penaeus japonicus]XP_042882048.1 protein AAR2 homolog [Penaeus japonicus]